MVISIESTKQPYNQQSGSTLQASAADRMIVNESITVLSSLSNVATNSEHEEVGTPHPLELRCMSPGCTVAAVFVITCP